MEKVTLKVIVVPIPAWTWEGLTEQETIDGGGGGGGGGSVVSVGTTAVLVGLCLVAVGDGLGVRVLVG